MHVRTGFLLIAGAVATAASRGWCGEVPAQRSYMYVGGQYIQNSAGQHVFADQMYVEKLTPAAGVTKPHPIVFIHGQAQTGTVCIEDCPSHLPIPVADDINPDPLELAQQARRRGRLGLLFPLSRICMLHY